MTPHAIANVWASLTGRTPARQAIAEAKARKDDLLAGLAARRAALAKTLDVSRFAEHSSGAYVEVAEGVFQRRWWGPPEMPASNFDAWEVYAAEGAIIPAHRHAKNSERLFLLTGCLQPILGAGGLIVPGSAPLLIPAGMAHGFIARRETVFISSYQPPMPSSVVEG